MSLILGSETVITVGIVIGLPVQATATAYPPGFICVFFLLTRNARKVQETMPHRKKRKTNHKKQPPKKKTLHRAEKVVQGVSGTRKEEEGPEARRAA